jgi:hypothetical protein
MSGRFTPSFSNQVPSKWLRMTWNVSFSVNLVATGTNRGMAFDKLYPCKEASKLPCQTQSVSRRVSTVLYLCIVKMTIQATPTNGIQQRPHARLAKTRAGK